MGINTNRNNTNSDGNNEHQLQNSTHHNRSAIPREMTYHYAGKVHVRGLLRRVWRPRYLSLGDDGYLRYHESIPPAIQQQNLGSSTAHNNNYSNLHHTHRPKTILAILDGARTIDPHSVVDQHVALPQGVFGFVFRGRPVELYTTNKDTSDNNRRILEATMNSSSVAEQGALIVPAETDNQASINNSTSAKEAVANLVFPKGSARRKAAQQIAKQVINPDLCGTGLVSQNSSSSSLNGYDQPLNTESGHNNGSEWGLNSHESHDTMGSFQEVDSSQIYGDFDDTMQQTHGSSGGPHVVSSSSTKSTVHVQVQASSVQSREYLCAVSTAAEAESWVVALRWAAEHRRRLRYANSPTIKISNTSQMRGAIETNSSIHSGKKVSEMTEEEMVAEAIARSRQSETSAPKRSSSAKSDAILSSLLVEQDGLCKSESDLFEGIDNIDKEEALLPSPKPQALPSPSKKKATSSAGATIIVTKVSKLRLPKNALMGWNQSNKSISWLPFHMPLPGDDLVLRYGIQLLLLRHCKSRNDIVQPESVEERIVYKSIHDMLGLVRALISEEADDENYNILTQQSEESDQSTPTRKSSGGRRSSTYSRSDDTSNLLEDIEAELLSCLDTKRENLYAGKPNPIMPTVIFDEISSTTSEALSSVSVIDSVMRKLSKDKEICSSHHFQKFLHLNSTHHKSTPIMMSKQADAEQIVKTWISKVDPPSSRTKVELSLAVTLRHQFAGPIISMVVIWTITRCISFVWSIIAGSGIIISISFGKYVTLLMLAFYFGHNQGVSYQTKRSSLLSSKSTKRKRKSERLPADETSRLSEVQDDESTVADDEEEEASSEEFEEDEFISQPTALSSPLPIYPDNYGISCWSKPHHTLFQVRSPTYLRDRVKMPSAPTVFDCRGVDCWLTDNAERNISRHPSVLGGKLDEETTFVVNFLLPFANLVAYFTVPPIEEMPPNIADVWSKFIKGDQRYRDGKLKLLPVVVDGPWIVKKAVGPGTSPAMVGKDLPLQYYFTDPTPTKKGVYEVDLLVTASRIARGILNVVKGHTKSLTIAFAFIIEASEEYQLPETVLGAFQLHSLHLEDCPNLPDVYPIG